MGQGCSCVQVVETSTHHLDHHFGDSEQHPTGQYHSSSSSNNTTIDPLIYDLIRRNNPHATNPKGQHYLLYKKGKLPVDITETGTLSSATTTTKTRLVQRKLKPDSSAHIYAIRSLVEVAEQRQRSTKFSGTKTTKTDSEFIMDPYIPQSMKVHPRQPVNDWTCVSKEHDIYVCDVGLSHSDCDILAQTTEQVCKGNYAAYTYAKQTLGCREFPTLAQACWEPVHRVAHAIWNQFPSSKTLQLDDREPHIVKYDISKKERQKLDMHTDKSEWTFLIALSDGCGLDYDGGGTYFEALDATIHVQRGHALIFPGKLRHCGQRITKGLRFLLVGFLVDKANQPSIFNNTTNNSSTANTTSKQQQGTDMISNVHDEHQVVET